MREPLVRASQLRRVFGGSRAEVTALEEATFEVHPGDQVAVVGPSGSGKSTLLHLMAALDRPTSGSIEWPALGPTDRLRPGPIAVAFQGPSLLPPLTVEENIALPLLLLGIPEEAAIDEARGMLGRLDLEPVASKLPEELSGGQSERAGVARALVGTPRLILADEPTGQQDRATGRQVVEVILSRAGEVGAALIVATHDLSVAERLPIRWSMENRRLESGVALRSA